MQNKIEKLKPNEIKTIIKSYIPLLLRLLKQNKHYSEFISVLKKENNTLENLLFKNFTSNFEWLKTQSSYWSINTSICNISWYEGWQDEYRGKDIHSIPQYMLVIFGMAFNHLGYNFAKKGYFQQDYFTFKRVLEDYDKTNSRYKNLIKWQE